MFICMVPPVLSLHIRKYHTADFVRFVFFASKKSAQRIMCVCWSLFYAFFKKIRFLGAYTPCVNKKHYTQTSITSHCKRKVQCLKNEIFPSKNCVHSTISNHELTSCHFLSSIWINLLNVIKIVRYQFHSAFRYFFVSKHRFMWNCRKIFRNKKETYTKNYQINLETIFHHLFRSCVTRAL